MLKGTSMDTSWREHNDDGSEAEVIECFIETQAFSPSYDLAPSPPPLSRQPAVLSLPVCRRSSLLTGEPSALDSHFKTFSNLEIITESPWLGLRTEYRSEKIPRNRHGTVSVISRKKVLIPSSAEEPIPKLGTELAQPLWSLRQPLHSRKISLQNRQNNLTK